MNDLAAAYGLLTLFAAGAGLLGALVFAGGAVAPLAVRILPEDQAAQLLRAFWPRYYRFGSAGGLLLTLVLAVLAPVGPMGLAFTSVLAALAALLTILLWLPLRLIPVLNAARDRGEMDRFDALHRTVLALTGAAIVSGAGLLALLGWALPGLYLVWMS